MSATQRWSCAAAVKSRSSGHGMGCSAVFVAVKWRRGLQQPRIPAAAMTSDCEDRIGRLNERLALSERFGPDG